jgi:MoaA/NifB/PqqE/SkfB family radical SAM enzyme
VPSIPATWTALAAAGRIARFGAAAGRLAVANVQRLDGPLKVTFALTYWCQYRCQTCNIWRRKPEDELRTEEVAAFVDRNPNVAWLDLTGGEIFLRPDVGGILDRLLRTWKRLALLHFPTNGFQTDAIVATARRIAGVAPAEIIVTVSLDGDEALNDEIRGMKGGFRRQIDTFRALRSIRGIRPVLGMTLSGRNTGRFEETFRACQRECPGLGIHDFHLNVAQVSSHYYGNAEMAHLTPAPEAARHELHLYRSMRGRSWSISARLEDTYLHHLDRFLATGRTPMPCHSLRSSCFIDPWGTVYPCITYDRPVGRLREHEMRLAPIWDGVEARTRQAEIWAGDCPQCWTACEAYQTILGNLFRPGSTRAQPASAGASESPCTHETT